MIDNVPELPIHPNGTPPPMTPDPNNAPTVLIAGSQRGVETVDHKAFEEVARSLGRALASSGFSILGGSFDKSTADYFVIEGALNVAESSCRVIRPAIESTAPTEFEGRVTVEAKEGTWERVRPAQVNAADAVVLIGGSRGTDDVFSYAAQAKLPIVLMPAFGGMASQHFSRFRKRYVDAGISENTLAAIESRDPSSARAAIEVLNGLLGRSSPTEQSPAVHPFHDDEPATEDRLGREMFAGILASRLRQVATGWDGKSPRPFLIHLHGAWGSGKSTVLKFLRRQLRNDNEGAERWIVIQFNAWQHQNDAYPWWGLVSELYEQAAFQLGECGWWRSLHFRLREWSWRFREAWGMLVFIAIIFAWLLFVFFSRIDWESDWKAVGEGIKTISLLIAMVSSLWGVLWTLGHTFLPATASMGSVLRSQKSDPEHRIALHFLKLIEWIDTPVAIQVDDLDRCKEEYVTALLEGIQTRFRDCDVAYVIAADRDWLRRSFEGIYKSFKGSVDLPGRPLGLLFLEKLFQLSVNVPPLRSQARDSFWRYLTEADGDDIERPDALLDQAEQDEIATLGPGEISAKRDEWNSDAPRDIARRYALARRMGAKDVERASEVFLQRFTELVEPNPRAMKRLVNAYGVQQQIMTVFGDPKHRPSDGQLALWTILAQRWPTLSDLLLREPSRITSIGQEDAIHEFPEELQSLVLENRAVLSVIRDNKVGYRLDEGAVRLIAGTRSSTVAEHDSDPSA